MTKVFDVVVIGAGPAGYLAAIRCAQLGLATACIEERLGSNGKALLGGCCLNVGCIPSKALLDSSYKYVEATQALVKHGIKTTGVKLDLAAMMARKEKIVGQLTGGIEALFKANGVTLLPGHGRLLREQKVAYTSHSGETEKIYAEHIILAPGAAPIELPNIPFDGEYIVDSTGALAFPTLPKKVGIIGAGAIGLELGSVWQRLGSEVVILEALADFLPAVDREVAKQTARILKGQGLEIKLAARVNSAKVKQTKKSSQVAVSYNDSEGEHQITVDRLVVAVGRYPRSQQVLSEDSGVKLDERGFIFVNDYCETEMPQVYAIGDAVRGPMLAHKGYEEGIMVAERIKGELTSVNYELVPGVIYTEPEVAWVGANEQQLKAADHDYKVGRFNFAANGRALAAGHGSGMVKLLSDAKNDRILGCHIVGPAAADILQQVVIAMEFSASSSDLALTMFSHPTLSEALHEAALDADGRALHAVPRKSSK